MEPTPTKPSAEAVDPGPDVSDASASVSPVTASGAKRSDVAALPSRAAPLGPAGPDPLLAGQAISPAAFPPELAPQQQAAANDHVSLEARLEAFEDIIDSEVGDTTVARARNIERQSGLRQLYLKFEGGNPTGTQKDRIAFAQAMDALRRGFDTVTLATCGNYGVAMGFAAAAAGLRCLIYVPADYRNRRIAQISGSSIELVRVDGDYERAVELSREHAERDELYDANPGGANTPIQLRAYGEIAYEIYDELRDAPAAIAVPVSNGTTLAGIYRGFLSLFRRGRTSRMPRLIAGSSHGKNPIVHAWLRRLPRCENLDPRRIRETSVNEPLVNWHAIDGEHALDAVRTTNGWTGHASDKAMRATSRALGAEQGLSVLPASTAGLIALLDGHRKTPLPSDRYVAVLTGRNG